MTAPNMAAITESLERSLQNCSLNTDQNGDDTSGESPRSSSSSSSSYSSTTARHPQSSETTLELNSHLSLPCHWEQCLDLKTGEVYYINWRNGMKAKEDPRTNVNIGDLYEEETPYDSEESSSESSPSSPSPSSSSRQQYQGDHVLVVAGCKSCFMYFMVPKQVEDCPKCNGQLLHFDRSETTSP